MFASLGMKLAQNGSSTEVSGEGIEPWGFVLGEKRGRWSSVYLSGNFSLLKTNNSAQLRTEKYLFYSIFE